MHIMNVGRRVASRVATRVARSIKKLWLFVSTFHLRLFFMAHSSFHYFGCAVMGEWYFFDTLPLAITAAGVGLVLGLATLFIPFETFLAPTLFGFLELPWWLNLSGGAFLFVMLYGMSWNYLRGRNGSEYMKIRDGRIVRFRTYASYSLVCCALLLSPIWGFSLVSGAALMIGCFTLFIVFDRYFLLPCGSIERPAPPTQ